MLVTQATTSHDGWAWRTTYCTPEKVTDSDFNPHHPLTLSPKPSFSQDSAPLPVHFSGATGQSDRLVLRSGPMACSGTLRTRLPNPGTRELDWFWTIRKFPRPEQSARLAQMAFSVFETASDTRYRYSRSSTNWSSRGSEGGVSFENFEEVAPAIREITLHFAPEFGRNVGSLLAKLSPVHPQLLQERRFFPCKRGVDRVTPSITRTALEAAQQSWPRGPRAGWQVLGLYRARRRFHRHRRR